MTMTSEDLEQLRDQAAQERAARLEAESLAEAAIGQFYAEQKHLVLLQAITVAANEAQTFAEAMTLALEKLCRHNDWPLAHVLTGEEAKALMQTG